MIDTMSVEIPQEARNIPLPSGGEQRGPYTATERTVLSEKWGMRFIIDKVINPAGQPGEQRYIEFISPGALLYAVDQDKNLWMINVFQYAANRTSLEVPGGTIFEDDEGGLKTVQAKALEEAGITITHIQEFHPEYPQRQLTSRVDHQTRVFFAVVDSTGAKPVEPDVVDVRKVPFDEIYQKAWSGELDNPSIAVEILRLKPLVDALYTQTKTPKGKRARLLQALRRFAPKR